MKKTAFSTDAIKVTVISALLAGAVVFYFLFVAPCSDDDGQWIWRTFDCQGSRSDYRPFWHTP